MGTQTKAIVDKLLTGVSNKIMPAGYISEQILTSKTVKQFSGLIGKYGNDHLRAVDDTAVGKAAYRRVIQDVRSNTPYNVLQHGLSAVVTEQDKANVELPFMAERDITSKLTTQIWLIKEVLMASTMTDTGTITQNTTLAAPDQYNEYTTSDPIGDFITANNTVYDSVGIAPDTVTMDWKTANTLRYHPAIVRNLGFADNKAGQISNAELASVMLPGIPNPKFLVGSAIYNSAKQGQADVIAPVWGKNVVFSVSPSSAAEMQVTLGYRIQVNSPRRVFRNSIIEPPNATLVQVDDAYDFRFVETNAAYLIKNSIA